MLERRLRARGIDATVTTRSHPYDMVNEVFPEWFYELATDTPDVAVINFGAAECQPKIWPRGWIMWLTRRKSVPPQGRLSGRLAAITDHRMRRFLGISIRFTSRRLGLRSHRLAPARFEAELERLVRWTRARTGGLVVVMTVNPAPPGIERTWARLNERCDRYSEIVVAVVARIADPGVRMLDVRKVVEELGTTRAIYDGFHYTPEGHDAVAAAIGDQIEEWIRAPSAASRPAPGGAGRRRRPAE